MTTSLRILVADNHTFFRVGLCVALSNLPGSEIVGETGDGNELVALARRLQPDLIFTNVQLEGMDGIDACKLILQHDPEVIVLALSSLENERMIYDILSAGARGFLSKAIEPGVLQEAIKTVRETNGYFLGAKSMRLAKYFARFKYPDLPKNPILFKPKELLIIRLICEEQTTGEIAAKLFMSPKTVSDYRQAILEKTKSKNTIGVVLFAMRNNLLY